MKSVQYTIYFFILLSFMACHENKRKLVEEAPLISLEVTDGTGRTMRLAAPPKRIVSIAPNITESIFAISDGEKLIARSQACDWPPEALKLPAVTTFPNLDKEQLLAMNPDIILTTDEIFTEDDIAQLEKMEIPVFLFNYSTIDKVFDSFEKLGILLNDKAKGKQVADSLRNIKNKIAAATENEIKYGTMLVVSDDPLLVSGGVGYINEIIELSGGKNVYSDTKKNYYQTTVEDAFKRQAEFLVIPSANDQAYANLLVKYPALYNLPADLKSQVYIVDPDIFFRPGPRTTDALLEMTNILHSSLNPYTILDEE